MSCIKVIDMNKLYFESVGPTKDINFYEYYDSKELFSEIKNNWLKFDEAQKYQKEMLKKITEVKMGRKTPEQEEVINNLDKFYNSRKEVIIFLEIMLKWSLMLATKQNRIKQQEQELKY